MVESAYDPCKIRLKSLPTLSDSDPRLQTSGLETEWFRGICEASVSKNVSKLLTL
jgi:hypothetical protein